MILLIVEEAGGPHGACHPKVKARVPPVLKQPPKSSPAPQTLPSEVPEPSLGTLEHFDGNPRFCLGSLGCSAVGNWLLLGLRLPCVLFFTAG